MSELAPGQTLDQYALTDVIARSGMATIFKATDTDTGQVVVLKIPHMQYESDIVFHERFLREEQIGLRLDHPAVIKVLRPRQKSRMYLVQEFVEGEMLSERLRREKQLSIDVAVEFALQVADALVYLHDHNVVHRDLKPENLMIMPNGQIKLMDFGIAMDTTLRKMTWAGLSHTMGTPDYMAPEQVKGMRGDARTDIYSLGAILYESLTGEPPYTGDNVYAAMRAKVREDPTPPRRLRHDIPPAIEEIVLKALEREPRHRFENALELREALAHPESVVLTNRADRQRPKSRLPRWAQNLLTIVGAVVVFAVMWWGVTHMAGMLEARGIVAKKIP